MNLASRINLAAKTMGKAAMFAVSGQWEGNERNRLRDRPQARRVSQDGDLNIGVREDLLAEARTLCQTMGFPSRILRQFANYTVGDCCVKWATSDTEWNTLAEESTKAWAECCDVKSTHSLRDMARLAVISEKRDGDIFIQEVTDNGCYELEMIEADRVSNAKSGTINIDDERTIGGVNVDERGRPKSYRVCDRLRRGGYEFSVLTNPRDIPAERMFHYFDSLRVDARRGVTAFVTGLNHLRDIKETIAAEKTAQKAASRLALIIKNATGSVRPGLDPFGNETTRNGGTVSTKEMETGAIEYLVNGDSIEAFQNARPGQGWFDLINFIIRDIAVGLDLPFEFVWNMAGLGGASTRLMSSQAERTFQSAQKNLERRFLVPAIMRRTMFEMNAGRLPFNPDFHKFRIKRPAHPSVDVGRESGANLAELDAGVRTEDSIAQETGEDGSEIRQARGREVRERLEVAKSIADEYGLQLDFVLTLLGRTNKAQAGSVPSVAPEPAPPFQSA